MRDQAIPILQRTVEVLQAVTSQQRVSAKALAIDLGIPRATCYRILHTLCQCGWLEREESGDYRVGFTIARIGDVASRLARVVTDLQEPLEKLGKPLDLGVKVSLREEDQWLVIARYDPPCTMPILRTGAHGAVHHGSAGAIFLRNLSEEERREIVEKLEPEPAAHLKRLRDQIASWRETGYTTDLVGASPALHAISCPVQLHQLMQEGVLTLFGPLEKLPPEKVPVLAQKLKETAAFIENQGAQVA